MKYLVAVEGELPTIFNSEKEAFQYIEELAEDMEARGVKNTDSWVQELKTQYFSQLYCSYPDIIIQVDADTLMKGLLS